MLESANNAAPFYPLHIKPSVKPLRFPFNLTKLLNNNLEAIPEQAYWEPVVIAPGPPRMAFFTGTSANAPTPSWRLWGSSRHSGSDAPLRRTPMRIDSSSWTTLIGSVRFGLGNVEYVWIMGSLYMAVGNFATFVIKDLKRQIEVIDTTGSLDTTLPAVSGVAN
jgi:hypothetical protein